MDFVKGVVWAIVVTALVIGWVEMLLAAVRWVT